MFSRLWCDSRRDFDCLALHFLEFANNKEKIADEFLQTQEWQSHRVSAWTEKVNEKWVLSSMAWFLRV